MLEPGGSFLVQDIRGHDDPAAAAFILEVERRRDPSHVRSYRVVEWQALLRGAGLTIIEEAVHVEGATLGASGRGGCG